MVTRIEAVFDGEVLRPKDPLSLKPNTHVHLTIETTDPKVSGGRSFLNTARSLRLEGPRDWASNLDDYLYGREGDD